MSSEVNPSEPADLLPDGTPAAGWEHEETPAARSRSEINAANRRTHGRSGDPVFELCRGVVRQQRSWGYHIHDGWWEDAESHVDGIIAFADHVLAELGPRPSHFHRLRPIDYDLGFVPGNMEYHEHVTPAQQKRRDRMAWEFGEPCLCDFRMREGCPCPGGWALWRDDPPTGHPVWDS